MTKTLNQLRVEYQTVLGHKPLNRFKADELQLHIDAELRNQARRAEQQKKEEADKARRAELVALRANDGWQEETLTAGLRDASVQSQEEYKVAKLHRNLTAMLAQYEKEKAKFIVGLQGDASQISHTLSWSSSFFDATAKADVAGRIIDGIKAGATYDQIKQEMISQALRGAANPPRSTSFSSNAIDTSTTEAWAEFARDAAWF